MMRDKRQALPAIVAMFLGLAPAALAQTPASPPPQAPTQAPQPMVEDDPDLDFQTVQPDFTLITLPTTLRMPRYKHGFRVTHRFTRPLAQGTFGDLLEDFLGFDSSAQIGLEYRFGLLRGTQVGIRRTNDRTIEFFGEHSLLEERMGAPLSLAAYAAIDGTNNFRDSYTPAVGAIVAKRLSRFGTAYVAPLWVNNVNPLPAELVDDNDTFIVGLGARFRVRPTVYLLGEVVPRVAGDDPGVNHVSFAIEKITGGHAFQANFSNAFGTTINQVARGGATNDNWYIGFNISRKFF
jgi:hypothetical protein